MDCAFFPSPWQGDLLRRLLVGKDGLGVASVEDVPWQANPDTQWKCELDNDCLLTGEPWAPPSSRQVWSRLLLCDMEPGGNVMGLFSKTWRYLPRYLYGRCVYYDQFPRERRCFPDLPA